jgi:glycosyltransferase involved in cell wall biosynthesis
MNCSIVISTANRAQTLAQTLRSIAQVSVPTGWKVELMVADNGSTDDTAATARGCRIKDIDVHYLYEGRKGKSIALNTALAQVRGDIILFTDDDVRFPQDWLEGMCEPILANKADAVAGQIKVAPHLQRSWMTITHRSWLASSERENPGAPIDLVGANMAIARSVLTVVPSFDPELGAGMLGCAEDTLFGWQVLSAGRNICSSKSSPVIHYFSEDRLLRPGWLKAARSFGRSKAYLLHHWQHQIISRVRLRLSRALGAYSLWRLLNWRQCSQGEGISEQELILLEKIHRLRHYLVERARPRNYELKGLVKLQHALAA